MSKKSNAPICTRCETPLHAGSSFCSACGGPTPWATHDERVAWEVRQWRQSRVTAEPESPQMMLVRTEAGFEPMAVERRNEFVWDQPLHPEREAQPEPVRPAPATKVIARGTLAQRPVNGSVNGSPVEARAEPVAPPEPTNGSNRPAYRVIIPTEPSAQTAVEPVAVEPVAHPESVAPIEQPGNASAPYRVIVPPEPSREPHLPQPAEEPEPLFGADRVRITVSKKAVALGIALVVGLPLGGKLLGLGKDAPPSPPGSRSAGALDPVALVTAGHTFGHLSADAVSYAVVVRNPNPSLEASGVTVNVTLRDARGRLVGVGSERLVAVPAAGAMGVAGAVAVSAPAAKMTVTLATTAFQVPDPEHRFVVRDVRLSRAGGQFVVSAKVSGVVAAKGVRVVAIHLDRSGKVVGGDFTYADIPVAPRSGTVVVSTVGVPRSVSRVQLYVLPPG